METFLKDYVEMIAEVKEIKLTETQLNTIVNNLMETEEIWDTLDYYVNEEINGGEE